MTFMDKGINDAILELGMKDDNRLKECFNENICPDIIAGENGEFWFEGSKRDLKKCLDIKENFEYTTIVVVLESPHKEEFNVATNLHTELFDNNIMANPALGVTGKNLQKYFTDNNLKILLNDSYPKDGKYRVVLMNSVQYQCSLGLDTNEMRDHVWLKMWFKYEYSKDFSKRLKNYNPDMIMNLCTLGNHTKESNLNINKTVINEEYIKRCVGDDFQIPNQSIKGKTTLREIVSCNIKEVICELKKCKRNKILYFEGNHPSSWQSNFNSIREQNY